MPDHEQIQEVTEALKTRLDQLSAKLPSAGTAWLADPTNPSTRQRLDEVWNEYWQALFEGKGIDLPKGYTWPSWK